MASATGSVDGSPRPVDHVVVPVVSLDAGRRRFESMGFQVAPEAAHPFGTANACVFLADGTYLELLAVGDPSAYETALADGAVFVMHDRCFRDAGVLPGISGVAFRSGDAAADRERLAGLNLGTADLFDFGRSFRLPDGQEGRVAFRLAFADRAMASDPLFFFSQPMGATQPDRSALTVHPNGARGLAAIVMTPNEALRARLQQIRGKGAEADGGPFEWSHGPNGEAVIGSPVAGLVIDVGSVDTLTRSLREAPIPTVRTSRRLQLPLGSGRSPFLAFQEIAG